jgi:hypothetical protein
MSPCGLHIFFSLMLGRSRGVEEIDSVRRQTNYLHDAPSASPACIVEGPVVVMKRCTNDFLCSRMGSCSSNPDMTYGFEESLSSYKGLSFRDLSSRSPPIPPARKIIGPYARSVLLANW